MPSIKYACCYAARRPDMLVPSDGVAKASAAEKLAHERHVSDYRLQTGREV